MELNGLSPVNESCHICIYGYECFYDDGEGWYDRGGRKHAKIRMLFPNEFGVINSSANGQRAYWMAVCQVTVVGALENS